MATSIQAPQRKRDSVSNAANSTQIKRVVKPTARSAPSETNKASSPDQNRHHLKPTKRSPPNESFRYVKKDGQNERNSATQGTPRTAGRTSPSPVAKPHHERVAKASKPGKIHQLYVKKTTLLSNGNETHDPAALTEISKDVEVDPVSRADNPKTKQGETFVEEIKKVESVEEEVTMPTEPVAETENVIVDASVSVGNREEERKKLQISDVSTGSEEEEEEKQSPSADQPRESLAEKEKDKKGGEELEETAEEEDGKRSTEERRGEEENKKMGKQGSAGEGRGKGESPPAYNEVIEETARKLVAERKNKVKALVGEFETVIDHESSSK